MNKIATYSATGITTIAEAPMLNNNDQAFMTDPATTNELQDTFEKRQVFRTETEMRISVLDDIHFPTAASKYWQCIREQAVMFENLVAISFDYRKNETMIKRKQRDLTKIEDECDLEDLQTELDECLFKRINIEAVARDRVREIRLWSQIKQELDNGSFDTTDVNTHQLRSYTQRFCNQANNMDKSTMSISETNNLLGQLQTAIRECTDKGILNDILAQVPGGLEAEVKQFMKETAPLGQLPQPDSISISPVVLDSKSRFAVY